MNRGIYINQHNIQEYGAKLQMGYTIGGGEIENITNRGVNRSSELLLRQNLAPLRIVLPLDVYGNDKRETMNRLAALVALLTGTFEVDLSDGYAYTCILQEIGETAWINDEICSVDITLQGFKHRGPLHISGVAPMRIYNPGTWPRTDCKLTFKGVTSNASQIVITLESAAGVYLRWALDTSSGAYTGGDLVLDGNAMRNSYNSGSLQSGTMEWTDYPFLVPGESTISVIGASAQGVEVDFTPTFL